MCKRMTPTPLEEFFSGMVEDREEGKPTRVFKTTIGRSEKGDGKYQVTIDGVVVQSNFESEHEATLFVRGFVLGFEMGSAKKS
jgi:hypothetical protein